jgi:hypothetical protein
MATSTSGESPITIDGQKYVIRTQVVYSDGLGVPGTLSTSSPIRYVVQYKPLPSLTDPLPQFINLGERDTTNKNNWIFTNLAGEGFRKKLIEKGNNSLTNYLDKTTVNALSKSSGSTKEQASLILKVSPNLTPTAVDQEQPIGADQGTADTSTNQTETLDGVNVRQDYDNVTKIDTNFFKGPYVYPNALRTNGQDYIQFTLYEYGTKDAKTSETSTTVEDIFELKKRTERNLGDVFLPIQQGISDQNMVSWADENMSPLAIALMQSAANPENIGANITNIAERITNNDQYQKLIKQQLYGAAAGVNPLARLSGLVINPNLELLFNGPTLRPFNFTFRLSPRNSEEGKTVKNIIRWFKQGSAVRTSNDNLFLKAPNVFKIKYIYGEGKQEDLHKGLNQIKTCALRSMNVNYTPDGSYMTFEDGTVTSYEMTLQFSELEPVYDLDYEESPKSDIGY